MRILLDSHALVWSAVDPVRLSPTALRVISDPDNEILVSAISAYELDLKRARDSELARMPVNLDEAVVGQGFRWISVDPTQASMAGRLPRLHGDPFDRILIAQALLEQLAVVSADRWFPAYGVSVLW